MVKLSGKTLGNLPASTIVLTVHYTVKLPYLQYKNTIYTTVKLGGKTLEFLPLSTVLTVINTVK